MKGFFSILRFIFRHPLSRGRSTDAILHFFKWQLGASLNRNRVIVDWVNNSKFITQKGETGLTGNLYCGLMEFEDMSFLLHFINSSDEFYDIGANVGAYTILASSVRRCKSYAFEPLPETYDRLVDQIKINRIEELVSTKNFGVGAKSEILEFTNSLDCMNKVNLDPSNKNVTKVPVITLDETFHPSNKSIVKIDVEGFEKFVLEGGKDFFKNENVQALIVELNGSGSEFGVPDSELDAVIREFGFFAVSYNPFDRSLQKIDGFNNVGNTIYVKNLITASERCQSSEKFIVHSAGDISL
jgi:FkbM family methyltransferase